MGCMGEGGGGGCGSTAGVGALAGEKLEGSRRELAVEGVRATQVRDAAAAAAPATCLRALCDPEATSQVTNILLIAFVGITKSQQK
jgi:hypothetical protein